MLKKLIDIASITMGQSPKSSAYNSNCNGLPFLQGKTTFGYKYPSFDTWTTEWNKEALPNDILFTVRAPVGDLNIAPTKIAIGRGIAAIHPTSVTTKYLYYLLLANKDKFITSSAGTIYDSINRDALANIQLDVHPDPTQCHIINTIGSLDDLIEKYIDIESKIISIGLIKINNLMSNLELQNLNNIATFEKGYEVGSSNYIENPTNKSNLIKYIRVGDLDSSKDCFIQIIDKIKTCTDCDILIAFDGAPGRLNVGLNGAYSSGIYKAKGMNKGLIYFSLLSELNQKIIKHNSQGTTILHASKAIPFLKCPQTSSKIMNSFDCLFNLLIELKKKKNNIQKIKLLMLNKYFTN